MSNERFIIDVNTRTITVPPEFINAGVKSDHNALRIYFEIGRTYDGEDLSTHSIAVQYINAKGEKDVYSVTDKDLTTPDKIIFSWELSNHVTRYAGSVSFAVRFYSTSNNLYTYTYGTQTASFTVLDGISVSLNDVTTKLDILNLIPKNTSDLTNDSGFISSETDPTVPQWAKQSAKPTYTATEVGALPATADGNLVHKTGTETIGGEKTFTNNITAPNIVRFYTTTDLNTIISNSAGVLYTVVAYHYSSSAANSPVTGIGGRVITHYCNATVTLQFAYTTQGNEYFRSNNNGVISAWIKSPSRSEFDVLSSNFVTPALHTQRTANVQFRAYKDKIGMVYLECYVINNIQAGGTIFTVPSDFIPSAAISKSFWLPLNSSAWGTHYITIGTNGNIITDNDIFRGNILFIYQK